MDTLRILLLEDSPLDAELILAHLAEGRLQCQSIHVQDREGFRAALRNGCPDLILSDYSLPTFDGLSALQLAQEICPRVPFLFVSGAMGEEVAIDSLKRGATDYVLKDRLERLVPAVQRALSEAAERTERERLEEELRQRAEELAEAHRRKDEFLAVLSHELRNPLAPVRNAVQLLEVADLSEADRRKARDIIRRQVERLSQLVDDLLDMSRVSRGKIQLKRELVDLSKHALLAVETVLPLLEQRQQRLTHSLAAGPVWVDADPLRLEQIITNLLTNATKYTEPGGRIELATERDAGKAVLRVRDSGVGIAPEKQAHIFDLFMQADPERDVAQGGLGIGLSLVKRLVELHSGTIEVASAGLGQGSEFTVRLPLQAAKERPAPGTKEAAPAEGEARRSRRILLVDDNRDGAESLAMLLRLWGHDVRVAHDGVAALKLATADIPDIALLDLGLPGLDGYQVAQRLGETGKRPRSLIALTGYGQEEDRRRTSEAGFDHHLTKPVDLDELQAILALPVQ